MNDIRKRIENKGFLLLDGAIGTELQRRGSAMDPVLWAAPATTANPHILELVHRSYVNAGSDVITTNTFMSSLNNVAHAGRTAEFVSFNRDAVSIARKVKESTPTPVFVAGSLSTMPPLSRLQSVDYGPETTKGFTEQIEILVTEGVDLLLLEMIIETRSARSLLDACARFQIPVWAGISVSRSDTTGSLIGFRKQGSYQELIDEDLSELVQTVAAYDVDAIGIMHSQTELLENALAAVRAKHEGYTFCYPNVGNFKKPDWIFPDQEDEDRICRHLFELVARHSLSLLGGCCGTGPRFIEKLAELRMQRHSSSIS